MEEITFNIHNDEPTLVDKLNREQYAKAFARLSLTCETPLVVSLYGAWGVGKTSLMKLIEKELDEDTSHIIWFNLWEHQRDENPVLSLAHAIADSIGGGKDRTTKKLLTLIAAAFGNRVLNLTTGMKISEMLNLGKAYEDEHYQTRDAQLHLKKHIKSLVNAARKSNGHSKRLVFFIDDLDRCMPDIALKLLEALKLHLSIEGCVYFIGVDRKALEQSIKNYHKDFEITESDYLDKIIQLPFTVPLIEPRSMDSFIRPMLPEGLLSCRKILVDGLGDNPRQVKRFINTLSFNHELASSMDIPDYNPKVLAVLLLIQFTSAELYRQITIQPELYLELFQKSEDTKAVFEEYFNNNHRLQNVLSGSEIRALDVTNIRYYVYLTRTSFDEDIEIDLGPIESDNEQVLQGRYILWVDDRGQIGTEGIERELQKLGVSLAIVKNTSAAERRIKSTPPDLIVSDIARGDNYNAGLEMAENFRAKGLFKGPIYFYAGDRGHGRIGRANKVVALIFTEPTPLLNELREALIINNKG